MLSLFDQSELIDLIHKVNQGERLNAKDGIRLMESQDILALGLMANIVRERKNGDRTYFMVTDGNPGSEWGFQYYHDFVRRGVTENYSEGWAAQLYGQGKSIEEHVDYLLQLRGVQDKNRSFLTYIPLPYTSVDSKLEGTMGLQTTTGFEDLRMLSVSRILLDNVDHIKAFWVVLGSKLAQVSQHFGVDDLDGRVNEDMTKRALLKIIQKAGRHAIERDSQYQIVKDYGQEGVES